MPTNPEPRVALELGCDHTEYESYALGRLSPRTVWAISVGADRTSPSLAAKGDPDFPNEDALLAVEQGDRVALVVADAHFGRESSHDLLRELSRRGCCRFPRIPASWRSACDSWWDGSLTHPILRLQRRSSSPSTTAPLAGGSG